MPKTSVNRRLILGLIGAACVAAGPAALAQSWPSKPVRIVVPFPAGGSVDTAARLIQPRLQLALVQPVLVENRGGASGAVGSAMVVKSPPDGHVLLMTLETHAINAAANPKLPYDTERDFAPIMLLGTVPYAIIVNDQVPAHSLAEFVAFAKARPGQLNYGSPASPVQLAAELFKSQTGIDIRHVPYRGGAPTVQSLLSNETQITFLPPVGAMALLQSGKLRGLALAGPRRLPALPDVPTTAEAGFGGYEATTWIALIAPGETPAAIVNRLYAEVAAIIRMPEVAQRLGELGMEVAATPPVETRRFIAAEIAKWTKVAHDNNIVIED